MNAEQQGKPTLAPRPLTPNYRSDLARQQSWVIAGAAGQKIGSAAAAFCRGAILAGLQTTQHSDYPVTVKTGHSIADVILSPEPILHMGVTHPDVMIVLFPEGLAKEHKRIAQMDENATLYITADLLPVETHARVMALDFNPARQHKMYWGLMAIARILAETGTYPVEAYREAVGHSRAYAAENLAALDAAANIMLTVVE